MSGAMRRVLAALGWCAVVMLAGCGGGGPSTATAPMDLLKADVPAFNGNGTWWNPAEPGTGFFFEAQGGTGVVTFYVFESSGRPTWVSAAGSMTATTAGYTFQGTLQRYTGGLPVTATWQPTPVATAVGPVTIRFAGDTAEVALPKRSFTARKFWIAAPATGLQPETGIYWNPDQSGRGYTLEVMGDKASLTMFHYDNQGQPIWHLVVAPLVGGGFNGGFLRYTGGQTLDGPYVPLSGPQLDGTLAAAFAQPCNASLWLPTLVNLQIRRFPFGSLASGAECRAGARTAAQGAAVASRQTVLAGNAAGLVKPSAVVVDAAGVSYVADEGAHVVWRIGTDGSASVLAGRLGDAAYFEGQGTAARFNSPSGITIDAAGVLYVSDTVNNAIRRITPGGMVSTLTGRPGQAAPVNGTLSEARYNRPGHLRADAQGNLYVAEGGNVRRIGTDGQVTTFAGSVTNLTRVIANAAESAFYIVQSAAVDAQGNLWVLETDSKTQSWIRKFDAAGRLIRLANSADGTWPVPYATDLTVDANGNVYVAVAGTPTTVELTFQGVYKIDPSGAMTLYGGAVAPTAVPVGDVARIMAGASGVALDPSAATGARLLVSDRSGVLRQLRP